MERAIRGLVLVGCVTLSAPAASFAYSCSDATAEELFEFADLVFMGRVKATAKIPLQFPMMSLDFDMATDFEIIEVIKGEPEAQVRIAHHPDDGALGGINYTPGETVLVVAYTVDGIPRTNICLRGPLSLDLTRELAARGK